MELTWIGGVELGNLHANRGQETLRGLKVLNCSLGSKIKIDSKWERRKAEKGHDGAKLWAVPKKPIAKKKIVQKMGQERD